jgi:hypothetical protein
MAAVLRDPPRARQKDGAGDASLTAMNGDAKILALNDSG